MTPIALTDEQLDQVFAAARPLPLDLREPFLLAVAQRLRAVPIGDGSIHRIVRELQSEFFSPPVLDRNHVPRWSSRRRNGVRASAES